MGLIFDDALLNSWMPVLSLLIMIATIINILTYLLGALLQQEKIKSAAKAGFIEIFYSAVIIAFVMFTVNAANGLVQYLAGGGTEPFLVYMPSGSTFVPVDLCQQTGTFITSDPRSPYYWNERTNEGIPYCHIRIAMYFLDTIFDELNGHAFKIYLSYILTSTLGADFTLNVEFVFEKAGFFTVNPIRGFFVVPNLIKTFAFETAIKIMGLLKFQEVLLSFISKALFPGLFMLGIIFRTFAFTRKIGGLLMAIALVMFFIYPMFYLLPALLVKKIKDEARARDPANLNPNIAGNLYVRGAPPSLTGTGQSAEEQEEEYRRIREGINAAGARDLVRSVEGARTGINVADDRDISDEELDQLAERGTSWFYRISRTSWYHPSVSQFDNGEIIDVLARLSFFSVFFGLLGILAAIASIRSLSVMLGGDIEIAGLTHLI